MPISQIDGHEIWAVLNSEQLSPGNQKTLRPFIRRIFNAYANIAQTRNQLESVIYRDSGKGRDEPATPEALTGWREIDYLDFLQELENERPYWQQALCLRMFLTFHSAPLSRVMSARWDDVFVVVPSRQSKAQKIGGDSFVWKYSGRRFGTERLSKHESDILRLIHSLAQTEMPDSPYWFPSRHGRNSQHIRSVDHVWHAVLYRRKMPYLSPLQFRREYWRNPWWMRRIAEDRLEL
jgi:integrase